MNRPYRNKIVKPTFNKIQDFEQSKTVVFNFSVKDWLVNNPIIITNENSEFKFELENKSVRTQRELLEDLDHAFTTYSFSENNNSFTCFPYAIDNIKMSLASEIINGKLLSLIEKDKSVYDNKYLRLVQRIGQTPRIGNISKAVDLKTDQGTTYGVAILRVEILNNSFDVFRISNNKVEYIFIDSLQPISFDDFDNATKSFFQVYSYIFGIRCGGENFVLSFKNESFELIENILFRKESEEKVHESKLFDSHEIRGLKFSDSFFLFPYETFSKMCTELLEEDKYQRALNIIHEANLNHYPLSKCILFSSALETISTLIGNDTKAVNPINDYRFENSEIISNLTTTVENNKKLLKKDKDFLIEKKLPNLNKPTNLDKFEAPFKKYKINLPDNLKKALKYRDKYFHGSIPRGNKLGTFHTTNKNRAFELQLLVNILVLKYVGYFGFIRNYSAELEFYVQREQGKNDEDIILDQSLYYKI